MTVRACHYRGIVAQDAVKLNLGCGDDVLDGWENYDKFPCDSRVKEIELEQLPWPFENDYADVVLFSHVLEHLTLHPFSVVKELHRITRPGGIVIVKVPVYCNIVEHIHSHFDRYYFNPIVTNPIRVFGVKIKKDSKHGSERYDEKLFRIVDFREHFLSRVLPLSVSRMMEWELSWTLEVL